MGDKRTTRGSIWGSFESEMNLTREELEIILTGLLALLKIKQKTEVEILAKKIMAILER